MQVASMSGSVMGPGEVVLGPVAEEPQPGLEPPPSPPPAVDEGVWTANRALRKFSQLTFAYGLSAVCAGISAIIMSVPTGWGDLAIVAAILPFLISLIISTYIFTDLLEFVWDGFAGRFQDRYGPRSLLWGATLALLLVGTVTLAAGIVISVLVFGLPGDYGYLTPVAIALLTVCGLSILTAVVLPAAALGPPVGRWVSTVAAALGSLGVAAEGVVTLSAPLGANPFLGWMEGTFPLLNWNAGFAALIALSAFMIWASYRLMLPAARSRAATAA